MGRGSGCWCRLLIDDITCFQEVWSTTPSPANVSDEAMFSVDCECCWSEATRRNVITIDVPSVYMILIVRTVAR